MNEKEDYNEEMAEESDFVGQVFWNGRMVDIIPATGFSISDMPTGALHGPINDIHDANDVSRFGEDEHLGYVYYDSDGNYDLRVA